MSIALVWAFPSEDVITASSDWLILYHIIVSLFAFCVLCLASLLAILLAFQESLLRYKCFAFLNCLPLKQLMAILLFQMMVFGWALLSVTIIMIFDYYFHLLALPRVFLKVVMALLSWLIFSVLLLVRYVCHWRGSKVIYATIIGVLSVVGVCCGSKIMLESIYR